MRHTKGLAAFAAGVLLFTGVSVAVASAAQASVTGSVTCFYGTMQRSVSG